MIAAGRWVAERPFNGIAGFAIWTAYSLFPNATWQNIVTEFLAARKDPILLLTFTNTTLGEAWVERGNARPWEELRDRAAASSYQRGQAPRGCLLLFLGVDIQAEPARCEWVLLGCGENYKRFIVDHGVIGKHISEPDCQRNLDLLLQRTWPNVVGRQIGISLCAITPDTADDVLTYCRRYGPSKVIAVRGVAGDFAPRIAKVQRERDEKRGTVLRYRNNFFNVGASSLKSSLYRDLEKDDPSLPG